MAPVRTSHLLGLVATLSLLGPLSACGNKEAPPAAPPATPAPAATETEPAPAPTVKADPNPTEAQPATPTPPPDAPAAPAPSGEFKENEVMVTPGTVVRDPKEGTPEWLVSQVLLASMDPDEAKGWERFVSLLSEEQKIEKALISRRELNFAASRRKVKLFLFEDPTKPIYKVDRVQQEEENIWRIFVHNNSPESMPTPCQVRFDPATKKWGVGICSL